MPILKGRRISKLRPEFVIMDPKTEGKPGEFTIGPDIIQKLCVYFSEMHRAIGEQIFPSSTLNVDKVQMQKNKQISLLPSH